MAVVAVLFDQGAVLEQAGTGEGDVGLVQGHAAAGGDALGVVEVGVGGDGLAQGVAQPGAREEAAGEVILPAGGAQAVEGALGLVPGLGAGRAPLEAVLVEGAAGEGEVLKGIAEQRRPICFGPLQRPPCPPHHLIAGRHPARIGPRPPNALPGSALPEPARTGRGGPLGPGQEKVAIAEAPDRVEQRGSGLPLSLQALGLGEGRQRLRGLALLLQGVRQGGAIDHALEGIPAAIGVLHRTAGVRHRLRRPARAYSLRAGAGRRQGSVKKQATAPRLAPKAPSFLQL